MHEQVLHVRVTADDLKLIDVEAETVAGKVPGLGKPSRSEMVRMLIRRLKTKKKQPRIEK